MQQIIQQIKQQGVQLSVKDEQLLIRGNKNTLTPEMKSLLQHHKLEIIAWLKANPSSSRKAEFDLNAEANLDADIYPQEKLEPSSFLAKNIFLTGATGFLAAFLLRDLLEQTPANIYCLVRATDRESGAKRLQDNLKFYGIWQPKFHSRIIPVLGDLTQPQLGLSSEEYQTLANQIDTIYHSAAFLNWVHSYSALKASNVGGTKEILRLACFQKVKPVHYISSVAVFESTAYAKQIITETERPIHNQGIYLGYSQSKWVAERLVLEAGDRGLPTCIYRTSFISGNSQTGNCSTDDFICRLFKGCIQMGTFPDLDYLLEMSPVDYLSQAIVYLSNQQQLWGKTFHLINSQPIHLSQLVNWLNAFGYSVRSIPYSEWVAKLQSVPVNEKNPLKPLLPFFRKKIDTKLTLAELYQQNFKPQFNCQATQKALAGKALSYPAVDGELLNTYFSYLIKIKFLHPPLSAKDITVRIPNSSIPNLARS